MEKQKTQNCQNNPEKHMYVFFGEMFFQPFAHLRNQAVFAIELYGFFIYFGY